MNFKSQLTSTKIWLLLSTFKIIQKRSKLQNQKITNLKNSKFRGYFIQNTGTNQNTFRWKLSHWFFFPAKICCVWIWTLSLVRLTQLIVDLKKKSHFDNAFEFLRRVLFVVTFVAVHVGRYFMCSCRHTYTKVPAQNLGT